MFGTRLGWVTLPASVADDDLRRRLLARTDALLERIEQLRLQGILRVPSQVSE
ncbi:MAG TPA: hypothetical protein VKF14_03435 [Candidatus Dormibacteraeota bacterium]|nr:hypothetical protein [Candidatus Dormibacteraeota bacterium]